jgi:glycosyltransferase involved in cell wall biosynthesis
LNIWIVSDGEPLPSDEGAARLRRMGMLSSLLSERGHEVHWFSSSFHHYKKIQRSTNDKDIKVDNKFIVHLLKTKGYKKNISINRILHYRNLAKKFLYKAKLLEKPDIIIATLAPLELSKKVVNYGEENGIPTIIDIRDLWPEIFEEMLPKWSSILVKPYIKYAKHNLEKTLKKSSSIIGVTPQFLEYGLNIANLIKRKYDSVFYTSYKPRDLSGYKDNFEREWKEYNFIKNDFYVVFLGNFGKQFVIDPLIDAAERLKKYPNIKFVLCGIGDSLDNIKKKSRQLDNVILPGWIEEEKILSLLSVSSIGIAPYRDSINFTRNTPNKFGEYLSASLPVFLGVNGIMEELVNSYKCGLKYNNSIDLAENIEELYLDQRKLDDMSINAYKLYNEKFNAEKEYLKFVEHLEQVSEAYKNNEVDWDAR